MYSVCYVFAMPCLQETGKEITTELPSIIHDHLILRHSVLVRNCLFAFHLRRISKSESDSVHFVISIQKILDLLIAILFVQVEAFLVLNLGFQISTY